MIIARWLFFHFGLSKITASIVLILLQYYSDTLDTLWFYVFCYESYFSAKENSLANLEKRTRRMGHSFEKVRPLFQSGREAKRISSDSSSSNTIIHPDTHAGSMHLKYVQLGTRQINPSGNFPFREWVSKLGTCYIWGDTCAVFRSSRNSRVHPRVYLSTKRRRASSTVNGIVYHACNNDIRIFFRQSISLMVTRWIPNRDTGRSNENL